MSWPRLPQEAKACKFRYLFNINEGLVLLKLADTVLILINTGPSNVKDSFEFLQYLGIYKFAGHLRLRSLFKMDEQTKINIQMPG